MATDRPLLGMALMLGFCILIPISDSIAKHLGSMLPLAVLLLARFAIQPVLLAPILWATGRNLRLSARATALILTRSVLQVGTVGGMYTALRFLPLADAIAILFVMPFLMLLLGHLVLGETVGRPRLVACAVGFAGVLLIVQPNFAEVGTPALLPLLVAVLAAMTILLTRSVARTSDPLAIQTVGGAASALIVAALLVVGPEHPDLALARPDGADAALLVAMGIVGTGAHLAMTLALRFAPTATLAPMQYLEIPASTFVGWLVFRDLPGGLAALGIGVTVASGLYVIWREGQASRRPAPPPAPPAA